MALLNFQKRFVRKVERGEKTHTIRAMRKRPIKIGEILHLYTGLRHKGARLIKRVTCHRVESITIDACGHECNCDAFIEIAGVVLSDSEREAFAVRDGFKNVNDMLNFWAGRLPFKGQIIHWLKGRKSNAKPSNQGHSR